MNSPQVYDKAKYPDETIQEYGLLGTQESAIWTFSCLPNFLHS